MKFTPKKLPVALTGIFASVISCISAVPLGLLSDIKPSQAEPEFSYGGYTNPTNWNELSTNWAICESGTQQSPIDIKTSSLGNVAGSILTPANIQFNYQSLTNFVVQNNGHTIQVNYPYPSGTSTMTVDGETYQLVQFHLHTDSEHKIDGEAAALELHLVHQNSQGKLAVVGVMIENGAINNDLQTVFASMPKEEGTKTAMGTINASNFLPANRSYYGYQGSLTTPPCSEGVKWIVLKNPITASQAQIDAFTNIFQVNARPHQDLNGRTIELRNQ
ncbi:MAG: carbonic anhydrase family protein [Cyanobacteriota bacterium]|nr:carbonic anhydrase family protein [Cyanobacteriota bacterium]